MILGIDFWTNLYTKFAHRTYNHYYFFKAKPRKVINKYIHHDI